MLRVEVLSEKTFKKNILAQTLSQTDFQKKNKKSFQKGLTGPEYGATLVNAHRERTTSPKRPNLDNQIV